MIGFGEITDFLVDTGIYIALSLVYVIVLRELGVTDYIEKISNKIPKDVVEDKIYMYILTVFFASMVQIGMKYLGVAPLIEYILVAFSIAIGYLLYQLGDKEKEDYVR